MIIINFAESNSFPARGALDRSAASSDPRDPAERRRKRFVEKTSQGLAAWGRRAPDNNLARRFHKRLSSTLLEPERRQITVENAAQTLNFFGEVRIERVTLILAHEFVGTGRITVYEVLDSHCFSEIDKSMESVSMKRAGRPCRSVCDHARAWCSELVDFPVAPCWRVLGVHADELKQPGKHAHVILGDILVNQDENVLFGELVVVALEMLRVEAVVQEVRIPFDCVFYG